MPPRTVDDSRQSRLTRRTVLGGATTAFLIGSAGCLSWFGTSKGATDVYVINETPGKQTIDVSVHDKGTDHEQIQTTLVIPANGHRNPTAQDKIPRQGDYEVTVDSEGGPSESYPWEDAYHSLYISLDDGGLSFEIREHPPDSWTVDN